MILPRILVDHEYWLRLATLFHLYNEKLFSHILHQHCKLPSDPHSLYKELSKKKQNFKYLLKFEKLSQEQYDTILPESGITDIFKFDVTTFVAVVRYCTKLKPRGGWVLVRHLKGADKSKGAFLLELEQHFRENLEGVEPILYHRFVDDWDELIYIFNGLKFNTREVRDLKVCEISSTCLPNKYMEAIMKAQLEFVRSTQRLNASKIRTLQLDDEENEIEVDISTLVKRSTQCDQIIDNLYALVPDKNRWKEMFTRLANVDQELVEIRAKIDFLHQLMGLEHGSATEHNRVVEVEESIFFTGEEDDAPVDEWKTNSIDVVDTAVKVKLTPRMYPCKQTRIQLGTKKLKTLYAYAFNKNEFLKDLGCCRQSYTDLELIKRRENKKIFSSRSMRESPSVNLPVEERVRELEYLFESNNHVLLRGIAGIGKTYLIREIVSKWVHGCLFENISFLFVLNYSDAKENPQCSRLEDLLACVFPDAFHSLSLEDMLEEDSQVLVIFDGWGKLERLDYVQIDKNNGVYDYQPNIFGQMLFDAINSESGLFKNSNTLITTRPGFFSAIKESLHNMDISEIDVLGFSQQNYNDYVFGVFSQNKVFMDVVKRRVEQNQGFEMLMRIPLNISMFCMIQMYNEKLDCLKTETELYLWKLALILQERSLEAEICKQGTDPNTFDNSVTLTSVVEAAQMSYNSQMGGIDNSDSFFVDHNMQEFLTSIYLCVLNMSSVDIKNEHRLRSCLPFVSGLQGLSAKPHVKYPCLMQNFVRKLTVVRSETFMNDLFLSYLPISVTDEQQTFDESILQFLEAYYEYQKPLLHNENIAKVRLKMVLHNLLPRDVGNLIHFLTNERYQLTIDCIDLHTHQAIPPLQMQTLFSLLLTIPTIKFDIKCLEGSSESFCDVLQKNKGQQIRMKDLYILQKCENYNECTISFDWIRQIKTIHLHLITNRNSRVIHSLKQVIPIALREKKDILLSVFKMSIATSNRGILPALLELLTNMLYLKEIHLYITEQFINEPKEPYRDHRTVENVDITEIASIKQALYKGLNANSTPKNLHRLFVKDKYTAHQFVVNKAQKLVIYASDNKESNFVDIDVVNL